MLTALSVARDCGMIEKKDSAVLVHVVPPSGSRNAYIEWTYGNEANKTRMDTLEDPVSFVINVRLLLN